MPMLMLRNAVPLGVAGLVGLLLLPQGEATTMATATTTGDAPAQAATIADTEARAEADAEVPPATPAYVAALPAEAPELTDASPTPRPRVDATPRPRVDMASLGEDGEPDSDVDTAVGSLTDEMEFGEDPLVPDAEDGRPAFVGHSALNMRVGPTTNTARIATLQPGQPVSIIETSDNWAFVVTSEGTSGWVYSTYLGDKPPAPRETRQPRQDRQTRRSDTEAPLRAASSAVHAGPSASSDRMFQLRPGEQVRVVERRGNWARVVLGGGITGWVRVQ